MVINMKNETYNFLTDIINNGGYMMCAQQAHETWMATKKAQGWDYGSSRDNEKKLNPLMRPFSELPADIQGQNSLTPYAVVNFFRIKAADTELSGLELMLDQAEIDPRLMDQLGEYVHSHFVAAQLAKGESVKTRKDMIVYENLDDETKSWDTKSALVVIKYLKEEVKNGKKQKNA